MSGLITQPYRRPGNSATDNFLTTLAEEVDLVGLVNRFSAPGTVNLDAFLTAHPNGRSRIWALRQTRPARGVWPKIQEGDLVVFYGYGEVYAYGTVSSKVIWPNNSHIWPSGTDWDWVYSLRDFHEIPAGNRLSYESLRQLTGTLGTQSVGYHELEALGLTRDEVIEFVESTGPRRIDQSRSTGDGRKTRSPLLRGPSEPPRVGEVFSNRIAIWESFGGHRQYGITQFEDDSTVNIFAHEGSPYDDVDLGTDGLLAYQGQGLGGTQKMTGANALLDAQRRASRAVRYWSGPDGGPFSFKTWAVPLAVDVAPIDPSNEDSGTRFVWILQSVEGADPATWPPNLNIDTREAPWADKSDADRLPDERGRFETRYLNALREQPAPGTTSRSVVQVFRRSRRIRALVLERANFTCENPACTGLPPDMGADGRPLLDVDHLRELAGGGLDLPSNMIALCPNCHRAKTHGRAKGRLVKQLQRVVATKELRISGGDPGAGENP